MQQFLNCVHADLAGFFLFIPLLQQLLLQLIHLGLRLALPGTDLRHFILSIPEELVVFFHVELGILVLIFVAAAAERGHHVLVLLLADLVEGDLVKVFKQPRPVRAVAVLEAQHVGAGDREARVHVPAGRFHVV